MKNPGRIPKPDPPVEPVPYPPPEEPPDDLPDPPDERPPIAPPPEYAPDPPIDGPLPPDEYAPDIPDVPADASGGGSTGGTGVEQEPTHVGSPGNRRESQWKRQETRDKQANTRTSRRTMTSPSFGQSESAESQQPQETTARGNSAPLARGPSEMDLKLNIEDTSALDLVSAFVPFISLG